MAVGFHALAVAYLIIVVKEPVKTVSQTVADPNLVQEPLESPLTEDKLPLHREIWSKTKR